MTPAKAFTVGSLVGMGMVLGLLWNQGLIKHDAEPVHYEHIRDLPHDAGEAVMTALVVEREPRPDGQRIMDQPAWTNIIGCPGDAASGPVVFTVKDDGFWSESKPGQYLPVTYFKYPGTDGQPPQYEFRGYAVQELVPQ